MTLTKVKNRFYKLTNDNNGRLAKVVMLVVALLIVVAGGLFINGYQNQLYQQRAYSLTQTNEKIVEVVDKTLSAEWDRLSYIAYDMTTEKFPDSTDLMDYMGAINNELSTSSYSWRLSCVDNAGQQYSWDGHTGRFTRPELLLGSCPQQQIYVTESVQSDAEQMIMMYRLKQPFALTESGTVVTHILLTLDMEAFGKLLEVSAFEHNSYSYITDQTGMRLYHQSNQEEFMSAYNVLSGFQNETFLYGTSYEELCSAMESSTPYTFEIERDKGAYFVSYAPLDFENWNFFLVVPEEHISGDTVKLIQTMLFELSAVALLVIVLVASFILFSSRQTIEKQRIAAEEARSASEEKSNFLSRMSHDIRTPLNGILGMCHLAKQQVNDPQAVEEYLDKIDISSHQLMSLINDVLDMTRIERGKVEVKNAPLNLHELLRECEIQVKAQAEDGEILFEKDVSALEHPYVMGDKVLMSQILTNLLGNSVKFTPEGGHIWLRVSDTADGCRFEVEDTGVGMTEEFLAHLFEPFTQETDGSRTKYKGTGLGLSIVKSLVERVGGTISVRSVYGQGSCFIVELPLERCAKEDTPELQPEKAPVVDLTGMRVLLAEDNDINRLIAEKILAEVGVTVESVENGKLAVERFEASQVGYYDLILMDLRMPVMDGIEAAKTIRSLSRADVGLPIVALTADAFATDQEKTRNAGMNDHLSKPIDIQKLREVLQKYKKAGSTSEK